MWMGHAASVPNMTNQMKFLARNSGLAMAVWSLLVSLYMGLLYLLLLVLLQLILRRRWAAGAAFILLVGCLWIQWEDLVAPQIVESLIVSGLMLLLLVRYGLVAALASLWAVLLLRNVPLTSDFSVWYSDQTKFAVGLLVFAAIAAATLATRWWRAWSGRAIVPPV